MASLKKECRAHTKVLPKKQVNYRDSTIRGTVVQAIQIQWQESCKTRINMVAIKAIQIIQVMACRMMFSMMRVWIHRRRVAVTLKVQVLQVFRWTCRKWPIHWQQIPLLQAVISLINKLTDTVNRRITIFKINIIRCQVRILWLDHPWEIQKILLQGVVDNQCSPSQMLNW